MAKKNRFATSTPRDSRKKFVTRHASRRVHRLFRGARQRGDISSIELELTMKPGGQTFDKPRIGCAGAGAQLMIKMADDEAPVARIGELMEQGDRITATGNADEVRAAGRKLPEDL